MFNPNKKVVVILGPTASGKSDIAIKLAKKFNGEIISADSRQIYRGMDIGTGKVTGHFRTVIPSHKTILPNLPSLIKEGIKGEVKKVFFSSDIPHYMIDIVNPNTKYNVAKFKKQADKIIADILKRGKLPIICGGTGFWIKAVVDNIVFPEVKPNWKLREKLNKKSAEILFKQLQKLDPKRAKTIESQNKVRLIRAIEICKAIGKVPQTSCHCEGVSPRNDRGNLGLNAQTTGLPRSLRSLAMTKKKQFLQIGISLPKNKLQKNIKTRLEKRLKQGMISEVRHLHFKQKISWKKIQSFGLGYYWIPLYLQKKLDKKELFEKVYLAEKNYAKKQMTWFAKDTRIKWLKDYSVINKEVKNFLKK